MIVARQTFGSGARFHPHLHTITTGGSWDGEGSWKAVFGWDRPVLRELFQGEVFRFLRDRELLSTERIDLIRSWRHSGFDVFVGEPIAPYDRRTLEHVARYLLRAPVSLERMRYDPQAARVTILPLISTDPPGVAGGSATVPRLRRRNADLELHHRAGGGGPDPATCGLATRCVTARCHPAAACGPEGR